MNAPKLTMYQRATLVNQYRILQKLSPDTASEYTSEIEALERGYEGFYGLGGLYDEQTDPPITEDETNEILDILNMHRALYFSLDKLQDKAELKPQDIEFCGWAGNEESREMGFTRWFCNERAGKAFLELEHNSKQNICTDFNGVSPQMPRYRRMIREWKGLEKTDRFELNLDDIRVIIGAGRRAS